MSDTTPHEHGLRKTGSFTTSQEGLPVPTKSWALRSAARRSHRTGQPWGITKFSRR